MMVFGNAGSGIRKQVFPIDHQTEVSQNLVDAAHRNDIDAALKCIADPFVDVNFVGTVSLKSKKTEIVLHEEEAHEVRMEYEEFKMDVTSLFLAAHSGNVTLVRKLLNSGANVNLRVFRGYATTAAVKGGHLHVLVILVNAGASIEACEEALLEASYLGQARSVELLMKSNMVRPRAAIHALVSASSRGLVDVVDTLIKHGTDANATHRVLLQSAKPFLHINVDCNPLFAAVVSRQIHVVRLLLQVGVKMDIKIKLGAWSWDMETGEEYRVGAGLAEAYPIIWCAVEYYEASGTILHMLLRHLSPNSVHHGRNIIHHAILCKNEKALSILLSCGGNIESKVETHPETNIGPIHIAARLGFSSILHSLITAGCNIDSQTKSGDSALMLSIRHKHEECLKVLASAGADIGLVNVRGECAESIAASVQWSLAFQKAILDVIRDGKTIQSSNTSKFSPILFVTRANDIEALKKLIAQEDIDLDEQDESGFSAAMVAAAADNIEAFRLFMYAGVDTKLKNISGQTAITLSQLNKRCDAFERLMLEYELQNGCRNSIGTYSLHRAAHFGDINFVRALINKGHDVNAVNSDGHTPLMLAARASNGEICELLISYGAKCDIETEKHETALSLARKNGVGSGAESAILDELARTLVLSGDKVMKHTKCGKGKPHGKILRMVWIVGVLRWGKSNKRNVICKDAEIGPSARFRWNRRRKFDVEDPGLFHVVTTKNKEVHFVCEGGMERAELWVRGIKLVTKEAIFGKKN